MIDLTTSDWPPVFLTVTVKVNVPPGSGRLEGEAVLETVMVAGAVGVPVTVTVSAGSPHAVPIGVFRESPE